MDAATVHAVLECGWRRWSFCGPLSPIACCYRSSRTTPDPGSFNSARQSIRPGWARIAPIDAFSFGPESDLQRREAFGEDPVFPRHQNAAAVRRLLRHDLRVGEQFF